MKNRKIKTWRDPYSEGFSTCYPKEIELQPGLTVLVGCNGSGKTTLIRNIQSELSQSGIPVTTFDNLQDGNSSSIQSAFFNDDLGLGARLMTSSEGECIGLNIGTWLIGMRNFILNGNYSSGRKNERLESAFRQMIEGAESEYQQKLNKLENHPERWILLDAADSGYSIDNIIELKDIIQMMIEDGTANGKEVYVIISANEYELARNENCFDVNAGHYIRFNDYEDFRKFILKSRKKKEKRIERIAQRRAQDDA